jgi:hypothetical protein
MNHKEIVKLIDKTLDEEGIQYEKKEIDEFFEQSASYKLTYEDEVIGEFTTKNVLALCNRYMGLTPDQIVKLAINSGKEKIKQKKNKEKKENDDTK